MPIFMTFLYSAHHTDIVFPRFAVLLASSAVMASQNSPAAPSQSSARSSLSMREFKTLRERANTAEDYRRLATWCQSKADQYRKSKANLEAELGNKYSRSSPQSNPKHPTRAQDLHALAIHYGDLSKQWTDLSDLFLEKAAELDARTAK
jgi:hypothetical protein